VPQDLLDNIFIGVVFVVIVVVFGEFVLDIFRFFGFRFGLGFGGRLLGCGLLGRELVLVGQKIGSLVLVVGNGGCNWSVGVQKDASDDEGSRTRHVGDELDCDLLCDERRIVLCYATDGVNGRL
jgi:hypothetical protein